MSKPLKIDQDLYKAKWLDSQSVIALQKLRNRNKKAGKTMSQAKGTDMATQDPEATTQAVSAVLKAIYRDGATATPRNLHRDLETITNLLTAKGDPDV